MDESISNIINEIKLKEQVVITVIQQIEGKIYEFKHICILLKNDRVSYIK